MTKEKKFHRFNEAGATGADNRESRPTTGSSFINSLAEGYALYAATVYPPLFLERESPRQSDVTLFRLAANEQRAGQAMTAIEEGDQTASAVEREPSDQKSAEMSFLGYLGFLLLAPFRFMQREREITQAINLLSAMDDRSLRDIGLHRSQIAHTVRYGKDDE
nr:DUF1127 domain-containing protein [uncultured Dongia sp.]